MPLWARPTKEKSTLSIESLTLHPTRDPHVQIEKPRKRSNLLLRSQDWYTQRPDTKLHSRRSSLARTRCLAPLSLPPKKLHWPESEFASLLKTSFKVVKESRAGILRWYLAGPLPWSWACCSKLSQIKFCAISWSGFEEVKTKILDAENPHFDYSRNSWVSVSLMASQNSSSEFVAVYCGCRILFPSEDQTFGESLMGKCCLIQVSKTICWILSFFFLFEPISPEWRSNCRRKLWWSRVTMSALQEPRNWSKNSTCLVRLVLYHCLCLCFSFCPYDTFSKNRWHWTGKIQLLHHLSQSFEDLVTSDMQWRWTENFIPLYNIVAWSTLQYRRWNGLRYFLHATPSECPLHTKGRLSHSNCLRVCCRKEEYTVRLEKARQDLSIQKVNKESVKEETKEHRPSCKFPAPKAEQFMM